MKDFLKRPEEGDAQEWVVMWGDMLSVLLTFFILLFGVSQMDQAKYTEIMTSIGDAFKGSHAEEVGVLEPGPPDIGGDVADDLPEVVLGPQGAGSPCMDVGPV